MQSSRDTRRQSPRPPPTRQTRRRQTRRRQTRRRQSPRPPPTRQTRRRQSPRPPPTRQTRRRQSPIPPPTRQTRGRQYSISPPRSPPFVPLTIPYTTERLPIRSTRGLSPLPSVSEMRIMPEITNENIRMPEITNENIRDFVQRYLEDNRQFPEIGTWDVSQVTDMSRLFYGQTNFNEYIGAWNMSHVENMESMFEGCTSFNNGAPPGSDANPIRWRLRSPDFVTDGINASKMFKNATSFNCIFELRNTLMVDKFVFKNISEMFCGATSFKNDFTFTHYIDIIYVNISDAYNVLTDDPNNLRNFLRIDINSLSLVIGTLWDEGSQEHIRQLSKRDHILVCLAKFYGICPPDYTYESITPFNKAYIFNLIITRNSPYVDLDTQRNMRMFDDSFHNYNFNEIVEGVMLDCMYDMGDIRDFCETEINRIYRENPEIYQQMQEIFGQYENYFYVYDPQRRLDANRPPRVDAFAVHVEFRNKYSDQQLNNIKTFLGESVGKSEEFYTLMGKAQFWNYIIDKFIIFLIERRSAFSPQEFNNHNDSLNLIKNKLILADEPSDEFKILIGLCVDYAFNQNETFAGEYLKQFNKDNLQAYGCLRNFNDETYNVSQDFLSCVNGIKERFILTLDNILYQICYTGATGICTEENKHVYENGFGTNLVILRQTITDVAPEFATKYLYNPDYRSELGFKEGEELDEESVNKIKQDFIKYATDEIEERLGIKMSGIYLEMLNKEADMYEEAEIFKRMEFGGRRRKQKRRTVKRRRNVKRRKTVKRRNKRRSTKKRNYRKKRRTVRRN